MKNVIDYQDYAPKHSDKDLTGYLNVIIEYVDKHQYGASLFLAREISDDALWLSQHDVCDESTRLLSELAKVMAFCQWRCCYSPDSAEQLLHDVDHAFYYDEERFEKLDETNFYILRQKALALNFLSHFLEDDRSEKCFTRALKINSRVIKHFADKLKEDVTIRGVLSDVLTDRASFYAGKDNILGRRYAIEALSPLKANDNKEYTLSIYNLLTDRMFRDYNPPWMDIIKRVPNVTHTVRKEISQLLLKGYAPEGESDYLSATFTHTVSLEKREYILIVENILEAAKVDFNKIQWVFTKDKIPHDIQFEGGEEPTPGWIYTPRKKNSPVYKLFDKFDIRYQITSDDAEKNTVPLMRNVKGFTSEDIRWEKCRRMFSDNLTKEEYNSWFAPMKLVQYKDSTLHIKVPSAYFQEQLESRYLDLLRRTLHQVYGPSVKLFYHFA